MNAQAKTSSSTRDVIVLNATDLAKEIDRQDQLLPVDAGSKVTNLHLFAVANWHARQGGRQIFFNHHFGGDTITLAHNGNKVIMRKTFGMVTYQLKTKDGFEKVTTSASALMVFLRKYFDVK